VKGEKQRAVNKILAISNLGFLGRNMKFENFKTCDENIDAFNEGEAWKPSQHGILFYGPTGTGKTHLACSIANKWIRKNVFCYFLPTVQIPRNDSDALARFTDPDEYPVLILDDIGAEKLTVRAFECLYILIEGRLWNGAPLISTTNYNEEQLSKKFVGDDGHNYGQRLIGRLKAACEFIPVYGPDHRG
jgi:DNA replication protein DnaC